jgi:hypothetical protein
MRCGDAESFTSGERLVRPRHIVPRLAAGFALVSRAEPRAASAVSPAIIEGARHPRREAFEPSHHRRVETQKRPAKCISFSKAPVPVRTRTANVFRLLALEGASSSAERFAVRRISLSAFRARKASSQWWP